MEHYGIWALHISWNCMEYCRIQWNFMEQPQKQHLMEHHGNGVLHNQGTPWNVIECNGTQKNSLEISAELSRTLEVHMEASQKCTEPYVN